MPFIQDKIVGIDGWYAWVIDNTTYYTKSKTPSVGDIIYNENKEDSGKTISAVGDGYIEFSDTYIGVLKGGQFRYKDNSIYTNYTVYDTNGTTILGNYSSESGATDYNIGLLPGQYIEIEDNFNFWTIYLILQGMTYQTITQNNLGPTKIKILTIQNSWIVSHGQGQGL